MGLSTALFCRSLLGSLKFCHATDGPPKMGPPGPSVANYVAMDGPPGPSTVAIDGPPGPSVAPQVVPRCHKWSPLNYPWK